jgi:hypothetical protein
MVPLIAFICVLESVRERNKFSNWKTYLRFFLFHVFDLRCFTKIVILQQCLDLNPNFFRIRIQPKYSDSAPQHCAMLSIPTFCTYRFKYLQLRMHLDIWKIGKAGYLVHYYFAIPVMHKTWGVDKFFLLQMVRKQNLIQIQLQLSRDSPTKKWAKGTWR